MALVRSRPHPNHEIAPAVEALDDPEAGGGRCGTCWSVGFRRSGPPQKETAEAEGGEPLPAHQATKIIGEVLAELDK